VTKQGTHWLEIAEGGTCQDAERKRPSEGHSLSRDRRGTCQDTERKGPSERHSLPGDRRGRDLSGHGKNVTRGTHILEIIEGGTCYDTERK